MAKRFTRKKAAGRDIATPTVRKVVPTLSLWLNQDWLWGLILVLAVILTYIPVWWAGFIWDDDTNVTTNPCIIGPLGLKEIWTTSSGQFFPLVLTMFWVEHALWGLAPLPYHLVNVLQHAMCAILLWRILRCLQVPGAWLGAALWALHPVQVESVAWVTEMKNTQSCLFYLLTILFFVRWLRVNNHDGRVGGNWNYALTLLFAALAMASKSPTVVLPVVLGLCAWWVEGRWHWRHLMRLAPVVLLSVITTVLSMWSYRSGMAALAGPSWERSWPERVATAGDAIWFYLGKLVWPHPLMTIYPRWQIDAGQSFSYLPVLAVIVVVFVLWQNRTAWSRPWFFAFAYFLLVIAPFLTLIDQSFWQYSFVEDHLQYLADMGPLALVGAGLVKYSDLVIPGKSSLQSSLCAGLLLVLGIASWQRAWVYQSEKTLWTDTLAHNPRAVTAYNNLGLVLFDQGQVDEAMVQNQKALEINPDDPVAHNNLGFALMQKGQIDEAIEQYQKTLKIDPDLAEAHYNLGNSFLQKGRVDEARVQYQKALEINPNYVAARNNLGNALLQEGRVDEAMVQCQKALEINPNYADAHNNFGLALFQKGWVDEALGQFQQALKINPDLAAAHENLGNALLQKGRVDEAIIQCQKALEINPNYGEAHFNLGDGLLQKGRVDEALGQFQLALKINPNYAEAHNDLGIALAQKGQLHEAIIQFQKALQLKANDTNAQKNLAQAQVLIQQKEGQKP